MSRRAAGRPPRAILVLALLLVVVIVRGTRGARGEGAPSSRSASRFSSRSISANSLAETRPSGVRVLAPELVGEEGALGWQRGMVPSRQTGWTRLARAVGDGATANDMHRQDAAREAPPETPVTPRRGKVGRRKGALATRAARLDGRGTEILGAPPPPPPCHPPRPTRIPGPDAARRIPTRRPPRVVSPYRRRLGSARGRAGRFYDLERIRRVAPP
jgi:hypothetical protein